MTLLVENVCISSNNDPNPNPNPNLKPNPKNEKIIPKNLTLTLTSLPEPRHNKGTEHSSFIT